MTVTVWNAAASAPPASGEERASCDESQTFHGGPSEDAVNATLSGVCPRGDAGGPGCLQETL